MPRDRGGGALICGRAHLRLPAKAGLPARHRRECRDPVGEPAPVIPAKAGIQCLKVPAVALDPHFRGGDDNELPRGEAGAFIAERNTAPGVPAQNQWRRPLLHAFPHVRHVHASIERAPDARGRPRPDPRRKSLGLPRRRRHVRRLRHHHHVERSALSRSLQAEFALLAVPKENCVIVPLTALLRPSFLGRVVRG